MPTATYTTRKGPPLRVPAAQIEWCPRCGGDGCPECRETGGFVLTTQEKCR